MPLCCYAPVWISLLTRMINNSTQTSSSVQPVTELPKVQDLPSYYQAIEKNFENYTPDFEQQNHLRKVVQECYDKDKSDCGIVAKLIEMTKEFENEMAEMEKNYSKNMNKLIFEAAKNKKNKEAIRKYLAESQILIDSHLRSKSEIPRKYLNKCKEFVYSFKLPPN